MVGGYRPRACFGKGERRVWEKNTIKDMFTIQMGLLFGSKDAIGANILGRVFYFLKTGNGKQTAFENIVGKGEIARNEQFLLFP